MKIDILVLGFAPPPPPLIPGADISENREDLFHQPTSDKHQYIVSKNAHDLKMPNVGIVNVPSLQ